MPDVYSLIFVYFHASTGIYFAFALVLQLKRNKFLKNLKANLTRPKGHNILGMQRVKKKERDNSVS